MISAIIIIGCCVGSALMYVIALQIGYLLGKRKGREDLEDKYWLQNMMIAQYDEEVKNGSYIVVKKSRKKNKKKKYDRVSDPYELNGI